MKKLFFAFAAIALMAGPAVAQEKVAADTKKKEKKEACHKGADASCCKKEQTAKGASCCMPSKVAGMKAAAAKKPAQPATKG